MLDAAELHHLLLGKTPRHVLGPQNSATIFAIRLEEPKP
jgi:hypothetical protein